MRQFAEIRQDERFGSVGGDLSQRAENGFKLQLMCRGFIGRQTRAGMMERNIQRDLKPTASEEHESLPGCDSHNPSGEGATAAERVDSLQRGNKGLGGQVFCILCVAGMCYVIAVDTC